ncbi:MAG: 2-oxoacid:acceptor oxidoreductase family protein [bacterium]
MDQRCIFAGFGGQGVISMGTLVAYAGMVEGKQVTFFPSYGIAMRGGMANCTVVVSNNEIGSPIVHDPNVVVAMNEMSFDYFQPLVAPGGLLFVNSSLVNNTVSRPDIRGVYVNATGIALEKGDGRMANMVMLGGVLKITRMVSREAVEKAMDKIFSAKLHEKNLDVMKLGFEEAK